MKKILSYISLIALICITSCSNDEEAVEEVQPGLSGSVIYNGITYPIANGILTQEMTNVGTEVTFLLADGTVTSNGSSSDSDILISIRAVSGGTSSLEAGTYETNRQVTSKYAFVTVTTTDVSNNQSFVGGTIDISGSDNTFSLTFNGIPFSGGIELNGSVNGTFEN